MIHLGKPGGYCGGFIMEEAKSELFSCSSQFKHCNSGVKFLKPDAKNGETILFVVTVTIGGRYFHLQYEIFICYVDPCSCHLPAAS